MEARNIGGHNMKYYPVPQIAGVVKDLHARAIPENKCQDCVNVMFEEGRVKTRWGYRPISANIPLSGAITHIAEFEQIYHGIKNLLVCTTRDIYKWNISRGIFEPLTETLESTTSGIEADANGLLVSIDDAILDVDEMDAVGIYHARIGRYGLWCHDNLIANVVDSTHFYLANNYYWGTFIVWYSCICLQEEQLPLGDSLGSFVVYDDVEEEYIVTSYLLSRVITIESAHPDITDGVQYHGLFIGQGSGSFTSPLYMIFEEAAAFAFTADISETERVLSNVSGDGIHVGAIIRISAITIEGHAVANYAMPLVITAYDEDEGTIEYSAPGDTYAIYGVDYLYNLCTAAGLGVTGVSFSAIHNYVELSGNGQYFKNVQIAYYGPDALPDQEIQFRLSDAGSLDSPHDTAIIYDDAIEDKVLAITNGVQPARTWDGEGQVRNLGERYFTGTTTSGSPTITACSGIEGVRTGMSLANDEGTGIPSSAYVGEINYTSGTVGIVNGAGANLNATHTDAAVSIRAHSMPSIAKYVDYFGSVGAEHVIIADTIDNTSGYHNPQTLEMSDAGEIDLWNSIFYDIIDNNDPIVGIKKLQTQLAIYKTHSISMAWPNFSGGNDDPFDFTQNKVNIGTPSIRTVVDFGDYHIFFGWDNVYVFNGIGVTPIGSDIMNDINASINRPFMNRSFACSIPNKNLYILFVPCGRGDDNQLVENPNRAYVFNYVEKHWSIWQLSHAMTAFGTFHQSQAPTWEDWLNPDSGDENAPVVKTGCSTVENSNTVTIANISGIQVGNVVEGDGVPNNTNVLSVSGTTAVLSNNATATGSVTLTFYKSWENMIMRWDDLILYEDNERYIMGDEDGYIYELSDRFIIDDDDIFSAYFITRDFPLNDAKYNFRLLQSVIGICCEREGAFTIEASVDFGRTWTAPIAVNTAANNADGFYGDDYIEHIVNWIERGRQVRFRISNTAGSFFKIESMNIGYADSGITVIQGA